MVKSGEDGSGSVPPFLRKCFEMVDDESTDAIVSWGTSGFTFVVWNMTEFSIQLLPKFFKHSNFSSFMRQLNIYGFRKTDTDRWEFTNKGFIKGQKHLLKNITRRKHIPLSDQPKSAQQHNSSVETTTTAEKVEYSGLWKEVENLKIDKKALAQELVKLRKHQESADNELLLLSENLQGMETSQQQMLSFLVMAMQNPNILVQLLLNPKEKDWRMAEPIAKILEHSTEDNNEHIASDGMIVTYQPLVDEAPKNPPESDPLFDHMKDLVVNVDFMKMLMDENQCSLENHTPLVLPDIPDDFSWEQVLLTGPFSGRNDADGEKDDEEPLETEMEMESTECRRTQMEDSKKFELLVREMEEFQSESAVDGLGLDDSVESLAEQIEQLASEP